MGRTEQLSSTSGRLRLQQRVQLQGRWNLCERFGVAHDRGITANRLRSAGPISDGYFCPHTAWHGKIPRKGLDLKLRRKQNHSTMMDAASSSPSSPDSCHLQLTTKNAVSDEHLDDFDLGLRQIVKRPKLQRDIPSVQCTTHHRGRPDWDQPMWQRFESDFQLPERIP